MTNTIMPIPTKNYVESVVKSGRFILNYGHRAPMSDIIINKLYKEVPVSTPLKIIYHVSKKTSMRELRVMRDSSGNKRSARVLGRFHAPGSIDPITSYIYIFCYNIIQLNDSIDHTLAHEIGHFVDYSRNAKAFFDAQSERREWFAECWAEELTGRNDIKAGISPQHTN